MKNYFKYFLILIPILLAMGFKDNPVQKSTTSTTVQFVYTSDAHYGLTKDSFQGSSSVSAQVVNHAMIQKINTISSLTLPGDKGVNAGKVAGPVDYVIMTGDISNREETGSPDIQSAATSWLQFTTDYINGLTLKNSLGNNSELLLSPGNHDVSNAIGYYKTMSPLTDPTVMTMMYNRMMNPVVSKTNATYNYANDKIHYVRNISGIHFMFINMWPDSSERVWMESDLKTVSSTTPVLIFTHDPPDGITKHYTNPNGTHDVNSTDQFENCISEIFKDGKTTSKTNTIEQRNFVAFLKKYPNIKAYFHGHTNSNEYYVYKGPDSDISLNTIRVDSPLKGDVSATDETKLSFQLVTIDPAIMSLTVRECLWDATPSNPNAAIVWGTNETISINAGTAVVENVNGLQVSQCTLNQNYPNPFNPGTVVNYKLVAGGRVTLKIYDVLGREVQTLVNEFKMAGSYDASFDASALSGGVYYYTLRIGTFTQTKKMLLLK